MEFTSLDAHRGVGKFLFSYSFYFRGMIRVGKNKAPCNDLCIVSLTCEGIGEIFVKSSEFLCLFANEYLSYRGGDTQALTSEKRAKECC